MQIIIEPYLQRFWVIKVWDLRNLFEKHTIDSNAEPGLEIISIILLVLLKIYFLKKKKWLSASPNHSPYKIVVN